MAVSDRTLVAYVDGELTAAERSEVEDALAADPDLASRLKAHRKLRVSVEGAFSEVVKEPVPERLVRPLQGAPENVAQFRPRPATLPGYWRWALGGAVAASFAAGLMLRPALAPGVGQGPIAPDMTAQGPLKRALETQLASAPSLGPARIGLTLRTKDRRICRTFEVDGPDGIAGLACRQAGGAWRVRMAMATANTGADGAYRTAASDLPAPVAELARSLAATGPMDAVAEEEARAQGWR